MNTESKRIRYLFLDNIKVLFTIIVIFWHTMVTYFEVGWWYYKESNPGDPFRGKFPRIKEIINYSDFFLCL